jgi:hypothetical protein
MLLARTERAGSGYRACLSVARDRVIGILLGNVVVYLLFTIFGQLALASASILQLQPCFAASAP